MGESIRRSLANERYLVTNHADERLRERGIMLWQVVAGTRDSAVCREFPDASPFPKAEFELRLADGTRAKAVWSWSRASGSVRLVTVHFL